MNQIAKLSSQEKAYLAGFLDGDGCLNAQIVRRSDYIFQFQIRVSVTFFQKTKRHWFLQQLQKQLSYGSVRKRKDGMSEYTLVGKEAVFFLLKEVEPFLRIKRPQLKLLLEIIETFPKIKDPQAFLALCERVDTLGQLNDSKRRSITSQTVRETWAIDSPLVPVETVRFQTNDSSFD